MKIGSLFSGYLGLDMAVEEVFGAKTVWCSDIDPGASKILAHRTTAPNLGDITKINWGTVEPVDIITGGFPCQDLSHAGKRAGLHGGTRSGLWSYMADAIEQLRPRYVVAENVRGLLSADGEPWHDALLEAAAELDRWTRVLTQIEAKLQRYKEDPAYVARKKAEAHRITRRRNQALGRFKRERGLVQRAIAVVLRDLAELRYDAQWVGIRAADVGAPHGRFRVFILATDAGSDRRQRGSEADSTGWENRSRSWPGAPGSSAYATADAASLGREQPRGERPTGLRIPSGHTDIPRLEGRGICGGGGDERVTGTAGLGSSANTSGDGRDERRAEPARIIRRPDAALSSTPAPTDASGERYGRGEDTRRLGRLDGKDESGTRQRERAWEVAGDRSATTAPDTDSAAGWERGRSGQATTSPRCGEGEARTDLRADARSGDRSTAWGPYEPAIRRWESATGRPAPAPTEASAKGSQRLSPAFVEWMMGLPAGWVTDVPGLNRNAQLKALGNGVVSQQAAAALKIMLAQQAVAA